MLAATGTPASSAAAISATLLLRLSMASTT
jgi:hypothetical protein